MEDHVLSLIFGAFGGGFASWFFYRKQVRWDAIREAGLLALTTVDAVHSNTTWIEDGKEVHVTKQKGDIASARKALNLLSLTCKNPDVVAHYLAALGITAPTQQLRGDAIVELRNALRSELGFGKPLAIDRSKVFIGQLKGCE